MAEVIYEFSGHNFGRREVSAFKECISREYCNLDFNFQHETDDVHISHVTTHVGKFHLSWHQRSGHTLAAAKRSRRHIRTEAQAYYVIQMPVRGSIFVAQHGRDELIRAGQVSLLSAQVPFHTQTLTDDEDQHESCFAYVPVPVLDALLPHAQDLCGIAFPADHGALRLARDTLINLFEDADEMSFALADLFFSTALETISKSFSLGDSAPASATEQDGQIRQRIRDCVELHVSDPNFSVDRIAKACGVSVERVLGILKEEHGNFRALVREQRLRRAFAELADPRQVGRSISEIAFSVGFKCSAHFSNTFRKAFGRTPSEVRAAALGSAP